MNRRAGLDTEAVVTAAVALADKDGLRSLSLTRLATELGVRPPSLYAHVDGIGDIVRRVGSRGARELAAAMGHAVEGRSGADALGALACAYRDYAREHPGAYEAAQLSSELQKDPEAAAAAQAATDVAFAVLRGYGLSGVEAVHAARLLRVTLHGFVALEAEHGFAIDVPVQDTFERIVAALDLVLRADAQTDTDAGRV
jgi:AcrR family transcriptional regulator